MARINLTDLEDAFNAIRLANKHDPKAWKSQIKKQLTTKNGIDEFEQLSKLKAIIHNFVEDQDIYSSETIYQSDRVIQNAYEFIEQLVEVSGYKEKLDD